jgi:hypothetical protein
MERLMPSRTISIVLAILATCAGAANATERTRVEVWHGGDDIYTLGLTYALGRAFQSSPDFILSQPGTLIVTIPTNLLWKKQFGRATVFYVAEFTSTDGQNLGVLKGSCSKDAFAKCAKKIVAEARLAAAKIH